METSAPLMPPETSFELPDQPPTYSYAPVGQAQYQPDAYEEQQHPYATPAPAPTQAQAQAQAQAPVAAYKPTVLQPGQPIPSGACVVYIQAPMHASDSQLENVEDCVGLGIFTALCCSTAFGLLAVVYSFRVRDARRRNDHQEAKSASKTMIALNAIGIVLGVVVIVIILFFNKGMITMLY